MTTVPTIPLAHGPAMPQLGLGTFPMDDAQVERAVATAIEAGYRLFDTAENYGNERGVGRGMRASGLPREELFVTTKFNRKWHGVDLVADACARSLERLGLDYLDLFLIHWPNPDQDRYVQAWEGLIRLHERGLVRAIGTSNFKIPHLQRIIDATGVAPDVNQIELNPLHVREAVRDFHRQHGIVTESWAPIGGRGNAVLDEPIIRRLAEQRGKTPAQIVLRWHIELGIVTIPKSSNPERIRQNIDIFDFSLSRDEVASISALDRGEEGAADSDTFGH